MYQTLLRFIIFTIFLALPPVLLIYTGNTTWLLPQFWGIFILITALTLMLIVGLEFAQKKHPNLYSQVFLILTIVKMIFSMMLALLLVIKTDVDEGLFMLNFFYIYFLNTGFEVYILLRNLRNQI